MNGILNIYKEKGFTSHDVVAIVRKNLKGVKTGHTGTLDPDAVGVLPVCVGKGTKIAEYITSETKEYVAQVVLGITTDTLDLSGKILTKQNVNVKKEDIEKVVNKFIGDIYQTPPMFSAIKINGKKLYNLAREGKEIEREPRLIKIFSIEITEFNDNNFFIKVLCSKGTYIRSLCNDIGEIIGTGAVMGDLVRSRSGNFLIENSITLDNFKKIVCEDKLDKILIPIDKALELKKVIVSKKAEKYLNNGNPINVNFILSTKDCLEESSFFVYNENANLIGIYELSSDLEHIIPKKMLN